MTMLLPEFELHLPKTVAEAVALIRKFGADNVDVMAGGSDLLCNYKWGLNTRRNIVGLRNVSELANISAERFGACVTLRDLAESEVVARDYPVLREAAGKVASVLIREQATVGGNLLLDTRCHFFNQSDFWRRSLGSCLKAEGEVCHVVPRVKRDGRLVANTFECFATNSSDLAPVFMVLDANLSFIGPLGERTVPIRNFYRHDGIARFDKRPGEVLVAVTLPPRARGLRAGYRKLRPRESWDFPVLGVAAAIAVDNNGLLEYFSLAVNAVDTHPTAFDDMAAAFIGRPLDDDAVETIAERVRSAVQPKLTVPMEPGYRKKMSGVFTRRLLADLRS